MEHVRYAASGADSTVPYGCGEQYGTYVSNPIGFAGYKIVGGIVESQNKSWKDQVEGLVKGPVALHIDKLQGVNPSKYGSPNDPRNRKDWKGNIQKALNNIKDRLQKMGKPLDQVLREKGWPKESIEELTKRLKDEGFEIPELDN